MKTRRDILKGVTILGAGALVTGCSLVSPVRDIEVSQNSKFAAMGNNPKGIILLSCENSSTASATGNALRNLEELNGTGNLGVLFRADRSGSTVIVSYAAYMNSTSKLEQIKDLVTNTAQDISNQTTVLLDLPIDEFFGDPNSTMPWIGRSENFMEVSAAQESGNEWG